MSFDLNTFVNTYNGGSWDYDKQYSAQCWDLYAFYSKALGYPVKYCTATGYAYDLYSQRSTNGILNNYTVVSTLTPGCLVFWNPYVRYPHVAIYLYTSGGKNYYLTQNTVPNITTLQILNDNYVGILKPKQTIDYTPPTENPEDIEPGVYGDETGQKFIYRYKTDGLSFWKRIRIRTQ